MSEITYLVDKYSDLMIELDDNAPECAIFTFSTGEIFKFETEDGIASDYKAKIAIKFVKFLEEDFIALE